MPTFIRSARGSRPGRSAAPPASARRPRDEPADRQPERRAAEHVGGVVHARGRGASGRSPRRARRAARRVAGRDPPDGGRRRERRGGVRRGKGELARRSPPSGGRPPKRRARAPHRQLDGVVDADRRRARRRAARSQRSRRSASSAAAASPMATQTAPHSPAVPSALAWRSAAWAVAAGAHRAAGCRCRALSSYARAEDRRAADPRRNASAWMTRQRRRAMVPGYRHVPGNHCGSTALRNLLAHHGAEISRGDGVRARRRARASTTCRSRATRRRASRTGGPRGWRSSSSS